MCVYEEAAAAGLMLDMQTGQEPESQDLQIGERRRMHIRNVLSSAPCSNISVTMSNNKIYISDHTRKHCFSKKKIDPPMY